MDWKKDLLRRAHDHLLDAQLILNALNDSSNDGSLGQFYVLRDKVIDIRMAVGIEIVATDRLAEQELMTPAEKKRQDKNARKIDKRWKMTGEEMKLVKDVKLISAIKLIRERRNLSLMDSKKMVDRYRDHLLEIIF